MTAEACPSTNGAYRCSLPADKPHEWHYCWLSDYARVMWAPRRGTAFASATDLPSREADAIAGEIGGDR